jgi:hypothetical protein
MALRDTILITHATPEDNLFASWLAARLTAAGYKVWVDLRDLRAGADFWHVIEAKLRNETARQIVVVTEHIRKDGVQKELALGERVKKELKDGDFIIPIRASDVRHSDFPVEILRLNSLDAHPNWASCLAPLLKSLSDAGLPRLQSPASDIVASFIEAREHGRRMLSSEPEQLLTNWFPITAMPENLTMVTGKGTNVQFSAWLSTHPTPHVPYLRLAGVLTDTATFQAAHPGGAELEQYYQLRVEALLNGTDFSPFDRQQTGQNHLVNLMRQHWDAFARRRGLSEFRFANGDIGWFFPDGLVPSRTTFPMPNGETASRLFSGKFKDRRWHLCLLAKPRLWPSPAFRVRANLVLSEDGRTALPGDKTQRLRARLTKSWWNDKWRDLMLSSMAWLADGSNEIDLSTGTETFRVSSFPLQTEIDVSYSTPDALVVEETPEGEIVLSDALDEEFEKIDDDTEGAA